jgi:hypothetical protein
MDKLKCTILFYYKNLKAIYNDKRFNNLIQVFGKKLSNNILPQRSIYPLTEINSNTNEPNLKQDFITLPM